jgi:hypothetical protein
LSSRCYMKMNENAEETIKMAARWAWDVASCT